MTQPTADMPLMWGSLLHLSYNMWSDRPAPEWNLDYISYEPQLRFDESLWRDLLAGMAAAGMNLVVIDLGDGVQYDSHPEIAVRGAWSPSRLRHELAGIRALGLEPIPKLNFSTAHDAWLGPYARCVSTDAYYAVCRDLIAEVIDLFDHPRLFHLGMDEETAQHQQHYAYAVIRQDDLWWHDLLELVGQVEKGGSRAWIWSDYVWRHPDDFFRRMPRSVLQSNWYYGAEFGEAVPEVRAYLDLDARGYDQAPAGSNWSSDVNFERTVEFSRARLAPERLKGFLQTIWKPTLEPCRERHQNAVAQVMRARQNWSGR